MINKLINDIGTEYFTLINWENYRGHIKDIRMITIQIIKRNDYCI